MPLSRSPIFIIVTEGLVLQHQITNIGPNPITVVDGFGDETVVEAGQSVIGVIQRIRLPERGRVEFDLKPFDDGKR
jgi:hypothetical protein